MTMGKANPGVDVYIDEIKIWRKETKELRKILLKCGLNEELKWGKPCYTFEGSNIVIIQGFKEYFALMFFKGALLKDSKGVLVKMGENTQAGRQMRFADIQEITKKESILGDYILEAIEVEKAGLKVKSREISELEIPEEFQSKLDENSDLEKAFYSLTPGRQRAYLFHFSQPKQSKTRSSRVDKCTPQILKGKGLNDR